MDKPLRDWTLGEVYDLCCSDEDHADCEKCDFGNPDWVCKLCTIPSCWDLTDPPRFTEQEVEDAKTLMRILGAPQYAAARRGEGCLSVGYGSNGAYYWIGLSPDAFPSIKSGETVKLSDIIGGNND